MRAGASASQSCGSTSLRRTPDQDLGDGSALAAAIGSAKQPVVLPGGMHRRARSAALLVRQIQSSSRQRTKAHRETSALRRHDAASNQLPPHISEHRTPEGTASASTMHWRLSYRITRLTSSKLTIFLSARVGRKGSNKSRAQEYPACKPWRFW